MPVRLLALLLLLLGASRLRAQIDPVKRELIQVGYNLPLEGHGPISAYAYYYANLPDFYRTNLTLRLAVAPVYLDAEFGFRHLLGPQTDLGVGISGGGWGDSYAEIDRGQFLQSESFPGDGGGCSASIYHLFNDGGLIPLHGLIRSEFHYAAYRPDKDTASNFVLPDNQPSMNFRTGLRWGGKEPVMMPEVAMEISGWYENMFRFDPNLYGFNENFEVNKTTHLFWGRALLAYTLPKSKQNFNVSLTVGTSIHADRFSCYRLGGILPLGSEFPLTLPGYYFQELSATSFGLLSAQYTIPLDSKQKWSITAIGATSLVDYLAGLEQPNHWNSGIGGGITYRSPNNAWQVLVAYGWGINAIRSEAGGAHTIGFLLQFDLERAHRDLFDPAEYPLRSQGLDRLFRIFQ